VNIYTQMNMYNIGLDIDGVIADFTRGWHELYPDASPRPDKYNYDPLMGQRFKDMKAAGTLDDFFLGLNMLLTPNELPFDLKGYVTARPIDTKITEQWLKERGFPTRKVITIPWGESKVDAMKEAGIEIFVDDFYENFKDLNDAGITTYLYSAPWNSEYDVGELRLNSLSDLLLFQQ
jgi:hypothetical protein